MCFLIQVFFKFAYGFRNRAIASLLFQALQAGQNTVYKQCHFLIGICHIFFVVLLQGLDIFILLFLPINPAHDF